MKKIIILTFVLTSFKFVTAQDMQRVIHTIDTLCSPYMFGRGYTMDGTQKAAYYLEAEFKKIGLLSYESSYLQEFLMDINTFPNKCSLQIGKQKLELGKDFLPHPSSSSGEVSGKIVNLNEKGILNNTDLNNLLNKIDTQGAILLLDKSQESSFNKLSRNAIRKLFTSKALLFSTEKLTHILSSQQYPIPSFIIKKSVIDNKNLKKGSFLIDAIISQQIKSFNVLGFVKGTSNLDSTIVFTAHYDHIGGIGDKVYFPGANDNASGTAMILELAHYYKANPSKYNIAFIAFGGEEAGLIGSKYYTENPLFPLSKIKVLFNLDLFATGEEGLTIVNGSEFPKDFEVIQKINDKANYLNNVATRGAAANSDHYFFYLKGVKSFFFYLRGNWPHYHDINDTPPVPLSEFEDSFRLLLDITKAYTK